MTKSMKRVRRQSFTLVEVIAVLLVIAILAAVAAPKFVSMADEARKGVARAGINEAKASLSVAYAKAYLVKKQTSDAAPLASEVLANAGAAFVVGTVVFGDITVTVDATDAPAPGSVALEATLVKTTGITGVTDTWTVPVQ